MNANPSRAFYTTRHPPRLPFVNSVDDKCYNVNHRNIHGSCVKQAELHIAKTGISSICKNNTFSRLISKTIVPIRNKSLEF